MDTLNITLDGTSMWLLNDLLGCFPEVIQQSHVIYNNLLVIYLLGSQDTHNYTLFKEYTEALKKLFLNYCASVACSSATAENAATRTKVAQYFYDSSVTKSTITITFLKLGNKRFKKLTTIPKKVLHRN